MYGQTRQRVLLKNNSKLNATHITIMLPPCMLFDDSASVFSVITALFLLDITLPHTHAKHSERGFRRNSYHQAWRVDRLSR